MPHPSLCSSSTPSASKARSRSVNFFIIYFCNCAYQVALYHVIYSMFGINGQLYFSCNCSIKKLETTVTLQHNILLETMNEMIRRIGHLENKQVGSTDEVQSHENLFSMLPCNSEEDLRKFGTTLEANGQARATFVSFFGSVTRNFKCTIRK